MLTYPKCHTGASSDHCEVCPLALAWTSIAETTPAFVPLDEEAFSAEDPYPRLRWAYETTAHVEFVIASATVGTVGLATRLTR